MKPLIAIAGIPFDQAIPVHANNKLYYIPQGYSHAVELAGGIPVIVPPSEDFTQAKAILDRVDGLLLTGGADVNPLTYGQEPHQKLGSINERRDNFELALVKQALVQNLPILGICRGLQIINVALGGTLYQDLGENADFYIKHQQFGTNWDTPTHSLELNGQSILNEVFDDQNHPLVNSLHHQAVDQLGQNLKVLATSPDGLVEAFELEAKPLLAVQWHPEAQYLHDENQLKLFKWLVEQAQK